MPVPVLSAVLIMRLPAAPIWSIYAGALGRLNTRLLLSKVALSVPFVDVCCKDCVAPVVVNELGVIAPNPIAILGVDVALLTEAVTPWGLVVATDVTVPPLFVALNVMAGYAPLNVTLAPAIGVNCAGMFGFPDRSAYIPVSATDANAEVSAFRSSACCADVEIGFAASLVLSALPNPTLFLSRTTAPVCALTDTTGADCNAESALSREARIAGVNFVAATLSSARIAGPFNFDLIPVSRSASVIEPSAMVDALTELLASDAFVTELGANAAAVTAFACNCNAPIAPSLIAPPVVCDCIK